MNSIPFSTDAIRVRDAFQTHFQTDPTLLVRGPGRINLLGEHVDYNGGFVLPAAIDRALVFALSARTDGEAHLVAADLGETHRFTVKNPEKSDLEWANYPLGVVDELLKAGYVPGGFNLVFGGNIPTGAGVSSSAALECGVGFALNELFGFGLSKLDLVKLGQRAENNFVGVACGIMDQFASVFGRAGSVIRLDCRSLEYDYFPFNPAGHLLLLCDTGVKHSLGSSEYNTRREECETGVAILRQYDPSINLLRDVPLTLLNEHQTEFPGNVYARCRYVVDEIERVPQACDLLLAGDWAGFGKKMYETHAGLQHQYEVSCEELDFLVDQTRPLDAVLGARMMGGGFGGCTINLLREDALDAVIHHLTEAYRARFDLPLVTHPVRISEGTSLLG